jgi:carbon monoxide dehydrogenase subunit G
VQTVTVERSLDASPDAVRDAVSRVEPFVAAAGFDSVDVEGDTVEVANQVGVATIELTLELVENSDADLAYVQTDGIFEEMATSYVVEPHEGEGNGGGDDGNGGDDGGGGDGGGSLVTATTKFALDVAVVGSVLDATVISRQRRSELEAQLDWLAENANRNPGPVE